MRFQILKLSLSVCMIAILAGCGDKDYELAPVSGCVTFNGKPMENVYVNFQPRSTGEDNLVPGPGSIGITDAQGYYTLQTIKPKETGAVVGPHTIRMDLGSNDTDAIDDSVSTSRLPVQCRDGSLNFTVPPEGTTKADFDLEITSK